MGAPQETSPRDACPAIQGHALPLLRANQMTGQVVTVTSWVVLSTQVDLHVVTVTAWVVLSMQVDLYVVTVTAWVVLSTQADLHVVTVTAWVRIAVLIPSKMEYLRT